jgi:ClpP class serine protease
MNTQVTNFVSNSALLGWLVFFLLIVQPWLKRNMLEKGRAVMLRRIEQARGSRVIALIHRCEVVNILGFPLVQYMDIQESEAILRAIRLTEATVPIDLILHTPAGLSLASEQIARALARHQGKVTVIIPHYAMSGGALLALAADELLMSPDAILGALDPTVGRFPAASVVAVTKSKEAAELDDENFLLVEQARKAVQQMKSMVHALLEKRMPHERAVKIAETLTSGSWAQDYPISVEEARELGLTISTDLPTEVYQFMNLFHQSGQRRPSVDFIPAPYTQQR